LNRFSIESTLRQMEARACYTFSMMVDAWKSTLPSELKDEEPRILLQLLSLSEDGISQQNLIRQTGIDQSRLSKLIAKLRGLDLIAEQAPSSDRRWRLYWSTVGATQLLATLESTMTNFLPG
jgi:DNA-binding MarR family transcriptional regulator